MVLFTLVTTLGFAELRRLLLSLAVLLLLAPMVQGATPVATPASAPAPAPPALTPVEAQRVLDILNDPVRRAAFATTLTAFLHADAAQKPAAPVTPSTIGASLATAAATTVTNLPKGLALLGAELREIPREWAAKLRYGYWGLARLAGTTVALIAMGWLVGWLALRGLARMFRSSLKQEPGIGRRISPYYKPLRRLIQLVVIVTTAVLVLQGWGYDSLYWFQKGHAGGRIVSSLLTLAITAIVAIGIWELANHRLERRVTLETEAAHSARLRTLLPILRTLLGVGLVIMLGLTMLSELGVDVAPLLAGAGILGVALGFGSQKLVQDFITGIFLLFENAMSVGDWVTVATLSGSVEHLSIRTLRLRAADGSIHIVPFSAVTTVTNTNRGIGNVVVSVVVAPDQDPDAVAAMLAAIAEEMRADEKYAAMQSGFQLWGVDRVDGTGVTVMGQIVCTDSGRWPVQREFNRRWLLAARHAGVKLSVPLQAITIERKPASTAVVPGA